MGYKKLMRLLLLFFTLVFSTHAFSQTTVSLKLHTVKFENLIDEIRNQTIYRFVYNKDNLPKQPISITASNQEALNVIKTLLENTGYKYTLFVNNLIIISKEKETINDHVINGIVKDINGLPISSASIKIANSNYGTITDIKGGFSVNVGNNSILNISHIGYLTKTIRPDLHQNHEIILQADTSHLSEIVVTALNIRKEDRKLGYSITTIKGDELTKARESNFIMALEGKVAGLNISGVSGGPASSSRILLRGAVSMNASSPLIILNGVPIDNTQRGSANEYGGADYGDGISNINPDDIETVTILKGSAASALYGARAANGVILIITRTGVKNSKLSVEYNLNTSFDKAANSTNFQYIYGQGTQNKRPIDKQAAIASGLLSWGELLDGKPTINFDGYTYPYSAVKNNVSNFYRLAPSITNTIAVKGGGNNTSYRISFSNLKSGSILKGSSLNRKTVNLNLASDITPRLNINVFANYINEYNKNRSYLSDGPLNANYGIEFLPTSARQSSLAPGYDLNTGLETLWNNDEYKTNPYFVINKQVDNSTRNRIISASSIKYKITGKTYLQGRFGYDYSKDYLLNVLPTGTAFTTNQKGNLNALTHSSNLELNADMLFVTGKKITNSLDIDISAGANIRRRKGAFDNYTGSQFKVPDNYSISNLESVDFRRSTLESFTQSAYYNIEFNYNKYINLSTTGRYDVFSTLPANKRGIFVPGVSGSFVFSDLIKIPGLNYGKLRVGYAKTSGEPSEPYTTQLYFSSNTSVNGVPLGDFSHELPNNNLKPFVLNEFETGFNLVFFNNRLGVDFTYFHRLTNNEITNAQQSISTGFISAYVNLGKTKNTGIEVMLKGTPVKTENFIWNVALNFSHINNMLLSIDGTSKYVLKGTYRPLNANTALVVGKSITQIMAYDYKHDNNGNVIVGSDGIPERGELKAMGGTLPTYYGGIQNIFNYKQFNFSFLVDYRLGNKILSATENYSYVYGLNKATLIDRQNGVIADGVLDNGTINTKSVAAYNYYPQLASNISSLSVLNGSFIKLRQVMLGYTFKPELFNILFKSVSIDLYVRNVLTLLKFTKNIDPESQFSPDLAYAGIEGASLPATKTIGINLNVKF